MGRLLLVTEIVERSNHGGKLKDVEGAFDRFRPQSR